MNRKSVLIITYYWPPCGGSGVQRWLKFVKYLRENGWEPVVYTPEDPECPAIDESLLSDIPKGIKIVKQPIREPYTLYKRFTGQNKDARVGTGFMSENKKPRLAEKISVWIRGNLFIPDARRFWINPSVRFLKKWLKSHPVDAVITTGPPHSMHMIGLGVHTATGLPWIADFRDPWTESDFYDDLMLTKHADRRHHKMERMVIERATRVVVVTQTLQGIYQERYDRQINLIPNGYDPADFVTEPIKTDQTFTLTHVGSMVRSRNPVALWNVLAELCSENETFRSRLKIQLVGKTDIAVFDSLYRAGLKPYLEKIDYLPHDEVIRYEKKAAVLLLILNRVSTVHTFIPAKIYEYLAAGRPVLCIGPTDTDSAATLTECRAGEAVDYEDESRLKKIIINYFDRFLSGGLSVDSRKIERYSRKNLSVEMASLLDEITSD